MNDVTPYPAINTVLTEWAEGLKRLLGKKIVGLYLSGSLAYGDFVPDRSDIDLQAVVQNPLTQDELGLVEQLHIAAEPQPKDFARTSKCQRSAFSFAAVLPETRRSHSAYHGGVFPNNTQRYGGERHARVYRQI